MTGCGGSRTASDTEDGMSIDAHLPGEWLTDPRMDALSDKAWRLYTASLMYGNQYGTNGRLPRSSLRLLHPFGFDSDAAFELVDSGLWIADNANGEFQVADWLKSQSDADAVSQAKEAARLRTQRHRDRKRIEDLESLRSEAVTRDVTRGVTRDVRPYVVQERPVQERTEVLEVAEVSETSAREDDDEPLDPNSTEAMEAEARAAYEAKLAAPLDLAKKRAHIREDEHVECTIWDTA